MVRKKVNNQCFIWSDFTSFIHPVLHNHLCVHRTVHTIVSYNENAFSRFLIDCWTDFWWNTMKRLSCFKMESQKWDIENVKLYLLLFLTFCLNFSVVNSRNNKISFIVDALAFWMNKNKNHISFSLFALFNFHQMHLCCSNMLNEILIYEMNEMRHFIIFGFCFFPFLLPPYNKYVARAALKLCIFWFSYKFLFSLSFIVDFNSIDIKMCIGKEILMCLSNGEIIFIFFSTEISPQVRDEEEFITVFMPVSFYIFAENKDRKTKGEKFSMQNL